MPSQRKIIAISLFILGQLFFVTLLFAGQAATVTHLSGPLAAHKGDGAVKAIAVGSTVEEGDTLVTEKRTYARLKFTDGGEVTLKPNSRFRVEKFGFEQGKPGDDSATLHLIKGGLRTITGQIGKRGNQDSYKMKTLTATIGIRGTIYAVDYCEDVSCGDIEPGLYLSVSNGLVVITNLAGSQAAVHVRAGQSGYVKNSMTPPVILPAKPEIPFSPPPSVGSAAVEGKRESGGSFGAADCQVR